MNRLEPVITEAPIRDSTIIGRQGPSMSGLRGLANENRLGAIGLGLVAALVIVAVIAPLIGLADPNEQDFAQRLAPVGSRGHLLGTDGLGRDMLSRIVWGSRSSLVLTFGALGIATTVGLLIGATAGYLGRVPEALLMRAVDVLFGLPPVLFAILVAMALGAGLGSMVLAITAIYTPPMARVAYASVVAVRGQPFIDAAKVAGASRLRIIGDQILPNILGPVVAYAASQAGITIVLGAGLSFVGVGIQPPGADWGRMINDGSGLLYVAPHVATLPGLAILVAAIAFNLVADAFRDVLDPRIGN